RLALSVRVGRDDHLGDLLGADPREQILDPQLIGAHARQRIQSAAQHVVAATELARALDRQYVLGFLDDTDQRRVAPHVVADAAALGLGDVAAHLAEPDTLGDLAEHLAQPADVLRVGGQQVERDALGTLRTDAGQPAQLVDQVLNDTFVHAYIPGRPRLPMPGRPSPPPSPPAIGPSFSCWSCCALLVASRTAATTRSDSVSTSSGSTILGSMSSFLSSSSPLTVAVTMPPPEVPV